MSRELVDPALVARNESWTGIPESERTVLIDLIDSGASIEAVKRFRSVTGLGLGAASAAVEAVKVGAPEPPPPSLAGDQLTVSTKLVEWDDRWLAIPDSERTELIALIERQSWIEAIERFEALTGLERPDVQDAIEDVIVDAYTPPVPDGSRPRVPLSRKTLKRVRKLFEPRHHSDAIQMLEEYGAQVAESELDLEYMQLAVLKLSRGKLQNVRYGLYSAAQDPRDVLGALERLESDELREFEACEQRGTRVLSNAFRILRYFLGRS